MKETTNKVREIEKEFYLRYGRFNSSTGELIGMVQPETIQGLWKFIEYNLTALIESEREETVNKILSHLDSLEAMGKSDVSWSDWKYIRNSIVDEFLQSHEGSKA